MNIYKSLYLQNDKQQRNRHGVSYGYGSDSEGRVSNLDMHGFRGFHPSRTENAML
jgi:hypothetical protein